MVIAHRGALMTGPNLLEILAIQITGCVIIFAIMCLLANLISRLFPSEDYGPGGISFLSDPAEPATELSLAELKSEVGSDGFTAAQQITFNSEGGYQ